MPLDTIYIRLRDTLVPVVLHPVTAPPAGYLSMQWRRIESERSELTRGIQLPKSERFLAPGGEITAEQERELKRAIPMYQEAVRLPPHLHYPNNEGVMCRVANPADAVEPKPSRVFSEIFSMLHDSRKVWLTPNWILKRRGAADPYADPLHTASLKHKPWIWEGCIPFIIRAALNPAGVGLVNPAYRPLPLAFPRFTIMGVESWELTQKLIEAAFDREAAGGFHADSDWITYNCEMAEPEGYSTVEAGRILEIYSLKPSLEDIRLIENQYNALYEKHDPAIIKAEEDPTLWQQRTEYVRKLKSAYLRLILERLITGRRPTYLPARELEVAAAALSLILRVEPHPEKREMRIIWKKDAVRKYRLSRNTIEFKIDPYGEPVAPNIKDNLVKWVRKVYIEPARKLGYYATEAIEGLPEEL